MTPPIGFETDLPSAEPSPVKIEPESMLTTPTISPETTPRKVVEVSAEASPRPSPASTALFFVGRTEEAPGGAEALADDLDLRLLLSTKSPVSPAQSSCSVQPNVRTPLASDMGIAVSEAWEAPDDEVLVLKPGIRVTGHDIKKLKGSEWLNDEVMNAYFRLIAERSEEKGGVKVFAFTSLFLRRMIEQGYERAKPKRRQVDIFDFDLILFPHHVGSNHWCLVTVDIKRHAIEYYDSDGSKGTNFVAQRKCVDTVRDFVYGEHVATRGTAAETFFQFMKRDLPQQVGGFDCGVFACQYAEHVTRRAPIAFSQWDVPYLRKRMAWEILDGALMT